MVQKAPCYHAKWTNSQSRYSEMCYSDLPYLYVGRGFAELDWPYSDAIDVRDRYDVMEYPVGISYYAYRGRARSPTGCLGFPNLLPRGAMSQDELYADPEVLRETLIFTTVNVAGLRDLRAGRRVVAGRGQPTASLGRRPVRGLAGVGARGPDQLGPPGRRLRRGCPVGAGARPAGLDRVRDRARHRAEALPAVPARRAPGDLGSRASLARSRGGDRSAASPPGWW